MDTGLQALALVYNEASGGFGGVRPIGQFRSDVVASRMAEEKVLRPRRCRLALLRHRSGGGIVGQWDRITLGFIDLDSSHSTRYMS